MSSHPLSRPASQPSSGPASRASSPSLQLPLQMIQQHRRRLHRLERDQDMWESEEEASEEEPAAWDPYHERRLEVSDEARREQAALEEAMKGVDMFEKGGGSKGNGQEKDEGEKEEPKKKETEQETEQETLFKVKIENQDGTEEEWIERQCEVEMAGLSLEEYTAGIEFRTRWL